MADLAYSMQNRTVTAPSPFALLLAGTIGATETTSGAQLVQRVAQLHAASTMAVEPVATLVREELHDALMRIEALPETKQNAVVRAQAVAVLYGGGLEDWDDQSPAGRLAQQVITTMAR